MSGAVASDTNLPITDAAVQVFARIPGDLQPKLSNGAVFTRGQAVHGPLIAAVSANASGAFQIASVPDGQYVVCAHSKAGMFLDNCLWGDQVTAVQVSNGAAAPVKVTLQSAAKLSVHVGDVTSALLAPSRIPRDLVLSVTRANGAVILLDQIAASPVSRDYQTLIPFNATVHFSIASSSVRLADGAGRALPASVSMPVNIAPGSPAAQQLTFNVLGAK